MNQTQQKYAIGRVSAIRKRFEKELKVKHTKKAKVVSDKEKIKAIREGDVEFKWNKKFKLTDPIGDVFDFRGYEPLDELDEKAFEKDCEPVRKMANKISDYVVLGDAETAMRLLDEFENYEI